MFLKEKQSSRNPQMLAAERSHLVIVDVQQGFSAAIADLPKVAARAALLARVAARLGVPVAVSEQYPKGLGQTLPEVTAFLPENALRVEKVSFSAMDVGDFADGLREARRSQIVVCGVEAHVCVLQTALDAMVNLDAQVYVVKDAVASRTTTDRDAAYERLAQAGATLVTAEMVIFEWLRRAGTPEFKEIQGWVK